MYIYRIKTENKSFLSLFSNRGLCGSYTIYGQKEGLDSRLLHDSMKFIGRKDGTTLHKISFLLTNVFLPEIGIASFMVVTGE